MKATGSLSFHRLREDEMTFVTDKPISLDKLVSAKPNDSSGARAIFVGYVRDKISGKRVKKLFYECYPPMAEKQIEVIVEEAKKSWDLENIFVLHRIGWLEIGEIAVVVMVDSAHRKGAFAACESIIDSVKKDVPIWKKEIYADETDGWVSVELKCEANVCK